jgi:hypothetical protein
MELLHRALTHYPNPKREGCPDKQVLEKLVKASVKELMADAVWNMHVLKCSPCYKEFLELAGVNLSPP